MGRRAIPDHQKKRSYSLALTPAQIDKLERFASDCGITASQVVGHLIEDTEPAGHDLWTEDELKTIRLLLLQRRNSIQRAKGNPIFSQEAITMEEEAIQAMLEKIHQ